jgi:phenylpropionate dioxygenase-like ring-hydroxylating dioxygenase large terminal subunit
MQKRSKTQIEQILATAKKQGISLPQHTVDSAHQLISELNAVADQNRQINLVRQKLIQATTNRSLDEIQALLKEVNHLGAAKRLQAQIVDAQKVLDSLQKDLSIQQKMDQAIRAKDVPALENVRCGLSYLLILNLAVSNGG